MNRALYSGTYGGKGADMDLLKIALYTVTTEVNLLHIYIVKFLQITDFDSQWAAPYVVVTKLERRAFLPH